MQIYLLHNQAYQGGRDTKSTKKLKRAFCRPTSNITLQSKTQWVKWGQNQKKCKRLVVDPVFVIIWNPNIKGVQCRTAYTTHVRRWLYLPFYPTTYLLYHGSEKWTAFSCHDTKRSTLTSFVTTLRLGLFMCPLPRVPLPLVWCQWPWCLSSWRVLLGLAKRRPVSTNCLHPGHCHCHHHIDQRRWPEEEEVRVKSVQFWDYIVFFTSKPLIFVSITPSPK